MVYRAISANIDEIFSFIFQMCVMLLADVLNYMVQGGSILKRQTSWGLVTWWYAKNFEKNFSTRVLKWHFLSQNQQFSAIFVANFGKNLLISKIIISNHQIWFINCEVIIFLFNLLWVKIILQCVYAPNHDAKCAPVSLCVG